MIIICVHCEKQIADDEIPDGKVSVGICELCEAEYIEQHPVDGNEFPESSEIGAQNA